MAAVVVDPPVSLVEQKHNLMRLETRNPGQVAMGKRSCH